VVQQSAWGVSEMIATYDISIGEFKYYNPQEWLNQLAEWRVELRDLDWEHEVDIDEMDADDILDLLYNGDLVWDEISKGLGT
jgi:hypothetical protein